MHCVLERYGVTVSGRVLMFPDAHVCYKGQFFIEQYYNIHVVPAVGGHTGGTGWCKRWWWSSGGGAQR